MNPAYLEGDEIGDRLSVPELVALYREAEAAIRAGFATIHGAIERLNGAFMLGGFGVTLGTRHERIRVQWEDPTDVLTELRRNIWEQLIERMQIRKAMSIRAWEDLQKQIKSEDPPPITEEIVQGMLDNFRDEIPAMLEAAVAEVFEFLRPHGDRYKTNTEFEIGERVCLSGVVDPAKWCGWGVSYYYEQHLVALENVFAMVDGRLRQPDDGYYSRLSTAIKACGSAATCHGETDLFEFRGYKNRSLHLRFKRMDLVTKLNRIAGGARLKPVPAEEV